MGYTYISKRDKAYTKIRRVRFIQQMVSCFVGFLFFLVILILLSLLSTNPIINFIVFIFSISVSVWMFIWFTVDDILGRKVTGIIDLPYGFLKKHKNIWRMLLDYFFSIFLINVAEYYYVDKNLDGFKKQIAYNMVVSFYMFVVLVSPLMFYYFWTALSSGSI